MSDLSGFEDDGQSEGGVLGFAELAPALFFAFLVSASNEQSTYFLLSVFGAVGALHSLPEAVFATMLTALSIGSILLQILRGLMAAHVGGRTMTLFCSAHTATCVVLLLVLISMSLIWTFLVVIDAVLRYL